MNLKPNGDPVMPDWLDAAQREAWDDIIDAAPEGVLWRSDSIYIALMADLLARIRAGERNSSMQRLLQRGLNTMGMTPQGRARMGI